ncbi:MAG TPA: hypothetical protein VFO46_09620, partial [Candidatus Sulfotelmatobacter sp.]|nr:hypothetical protein [Candidatus Sulfotelmatobacter sp.]
LCGSALFAQTPTPIIKKMELSPVRLMPQAPPAGLQKLFSNLGTKWPYYKGREGWTLAGPDAAITEFVAMPFISPVDAHITQVRIPVKYETGTNQVNISIYSGPSGANGTPKTLIAGPVTVTNLPAYGTCCALTIVKFSPTPIVAGARYWVVADTPSAGTGSDFNGAWDWVPPEPPPGDAFSAPDSLWVTGPSELDAAAGEVFGTVP